MPHIYKTLLSLYGLWAKGVCEYFQWKLPAAIVVLLYIFIFYIENILYIEPAYLTEQNKVLSFYSIGNFLILKKPPGCVSFSEFIVNWNCS